MQPFKFKKGLSFSALSLFNGIELFSLFVFRLSSLELCKDLLRKYKTLMDNEKSWISQTSAKVNTMLTRNDLEYVTVSLNSIHFVLNLNFF